MTFRQNISRPRDDGFYLPAEWCRHARSWIAWPVAGSEAIKRSVADIIHAVKAHEPVIVLINPDDQAEFQNLCGHSIDTMVVPHNSARLRDFGPTFLVDGKGGSAAVDWHFDGWGDSVTRWGDDQKAGHTLLGEAEVRRFRAPLTLEGTAICSDGEGTVLVHAHTALDPNRNTGLNKLDAFDVISHWLGINRVIWIDESSDSKVSAGNIRQYCAYLRPGVIAVGEYHQNPWADHLDNIAERLSHAEDGRGHSLKVVRLPFKVIGGLPCPYTTFYVLNKAVLVPSYGIPADDKAAALIRDAFPGRAIECVPAKALIEEDISLSSLIQYQPARLLERSKATLLPRSAWQRPVPDYVSLLQDYIEKVEAED